jgi:hypothetical protein
LSAKSFMLLIFFLGISNLFGQTKRTQDYSCVLGWWKSLTAWLNNISLSEASNLISIATPGVLIAWFYYSQKNTYSKEYYSEIAGVYGGFNEPVTKFDEKKERIYAGGIMNIVDVDSNGYFRGELNYGENRSSNTNGTITFEQVTRGIQTFTGYLDYRMFWKRKRDSYNANKNRKYKGRLYIVHRLDFQFEKMKIEEYTERIYDIVHYREMKVLVFKLRKVTDKDHSNLPHEFKLYRDMGLSFEPSRNVKETAFAGNKVLH